MENKYFQKTVWFLFILVLSLQLMSIFFNAGFYFFFPKDPPPEIIIAPKPEYCPDVEKTNCIDFNREAITPIPFEQYLQDAARFKNSVGDYLATEYKRLGYNQEPSMMVTFSRDKILSFINEIDKYACFYDQNLDSINIAISFTMYDNLTCNTNKYGHQQNHSQMTVHLIPSYGDTLMDVINNVPLDSSSGNVVMASTYTYVENAGKIMNHGQLCPPSCSSYSQRMLNTMSRSYYYSSLDLVTCNKQ